MRESLLSRHLLAGGGLRQQLEEQVDGDGDGDGDSKQTRERGSSLLHGRISGFGVGASQFYAFFLLFLGALFLTGCSFRSGGGGADSGGWFLKAGSDVSGSVEFLLDPRDPGVRMSLLSCGRLLGSGQPPKAVAVGRRALGFLRVNTGCFWGGGAAIVSGLRVSIVGALSGNRAVHVLPVVVGGSGAVAVAGSEVWRLGGNPTLEVGLLGLDVGSGLRSWACCLFLQWLVVGLFSDLLGLFSAVGLAELGFYGPK